MTPISIFLLANSLLVAWLVLIWSSRGIDGFIRLVLLVDCLASMYFFMYTIGLVTVGAVRFI